MLSKIIPDWKKNALQRNISMKMIIISENKIKPKQE